MNLFFSMNPSILKVFKQLILERSAITIKGNDSSIQTTQLEKQDIDSMMPIAAKSIIKNPDDTILNDIVKNHIQSFKMSQLLYKMLNQKHQKVVTEMRIL